ncbi:MAG TPA: hypothetical protein VGP47_11430 [Parachlamydiaceae bacterium]|nr:hypothetical protein [Parachlamydiaceae bacterium]
MEFNNPNVIAIDTETNNNDNISFKNIFHSNNNHIVENKFSYELQNNLGFKGSNLSANHININANDAVTRSIFNLSFLQKKIELQLKTAFKQAATGYGEYISNGLNGLTNVALAAIYSPIGLIKTVVDIAADKFLSDPKWIKNKYTLGVPTKFPSFIKKYAEHSDRSTINLNSPLGQLVQPVLATAFEADARISHASFLTSLRTALSSEIYKLELEKCQNNDLTYDPLLNVVLELCRMLYEEGHFYDFLNALMTHIGITGNEKLNENDFSIIENLTNEEKLSTYEVASNKAKGQVNEFGLWSFDPHLQGNIPFVLGKVKIAEKDVTLMRFGTITKGSEIVEEFMGYLTNLDMNKKNHLYISLQNNKPKSRVAGDESVRNEAIKNVQSKFKNFFAVILAQDSPFYKQVGFYKQGKDQVGEDRTKDQVGEDRTKDQKSSAFKQDFYNQMMGEDTNGENTGFYFPDSWIKDPDFTHNIKNLQNLVLKTFYNDAKVLTRQDKQDFIEIFYAYLSIFLINYSKADNVNITCKDAIDRAGKLNSLVLKLVMTIQGNVDEESNQRFHKVMTHAPAFWTKTQAIINHDKDTSNGRRARLLTADAKLNEKKDQIMENNIPITKTDSQTTNLIAPGTIEIKKITMPELIALV